MLLSLRLSAQTPAAYTAAIQQWHEQRIEGLKAPNGWLNLAGLFWLEEGRNSFGSDKSNKIVFPAGKIEGTAGYFQRVGGSVKLVVTGDAPVTVNGRPVKEAIIFSRDSARPAVVACGSLRWTIIQREDKLGIRLRDLGSPELTAFRDIDRFPVDTTWRIRAVFQPASGPQSIAITNVIGQTSQQQTPGRLLFTFHNQQYSLDALDEGPELFIVFADGTSGKSTYVSGRFLAVDRPADGNNTTFIDFNKAYNPPCAFTNYATCPLPPKQNVLPFDVEAGEKDYGRHEEIR